jgi:ferritin-like metal-binding protein YciE
MERTREAHGYDQAPENRPGVPMEAEPRRDPGAHGETPPRQQSGEEHLRRAGLDEMTPVYGTAQPPGGASGILRRLAYRIPEHEARRWLLLLLADRVDVLEHRAPELLRGEGWGQLGRQMKANPWMAGGLLLGVAYLVKRGNLLEHLAGALPGSRSHTPEEEKLLAWLNDAYAMERAQIPILKNHAEDARHYPRIRAKDLEHLEQTRRQAERIRGCIERLGGRVSATKTALGRMTGVMNSVASGPFEDEIVKNFLSDYAAEHLEIASYRALITAAREAGDGETARVCEEILREEEAMARWLEQNLPMAVREALANEW